MLPEFEPIEVIRRLKDRKALKQYFREVRYVIPDTFERLFIMQQLGLSNVIKEESEEAARKGVLRLIAYYIQYFTHEPESFDPETPIGKRNLEQVAVLRDFCEKKEWHQMKALMRFILRTAGGEQ